MAQRILVVDDDPVVQMISTEYLTSAGYSVATAGSSAEGLEQIESLNPDLLLLDMILPDGNGIEVVHGLKQSGRLAELPVIMLSADRDTETMARKQNLRICGFLEKPFDGKTLIEKVRECLAPDIS